MVSGGSKKVAASNSEANMLDEERMLSPDDVLWQESIERTDAVDFEHTDTDRVRSRL